jgi:hypothetical protein
MGEMGNRNHSWNRLKIVAGLMGITFAVTLALIVGYRLSDEALAVLAGAVCGVGAAIPTSLLVIMVNRRRDERMQPSTQPVMQHGVYPPVVVIAPPGGQQAPRDWGMSPPPLTTPTQRQFTVVGETLANGEVRSYGRYS